MIKEIIPGRMIKCLQGLHPNERLFITEYWNVLPNIKGFALICLEGSGGLSVKDQSNASRSIPKLLSGRPECTRLCDMRPPSPPLLHHTCTTMINSYVLQPRRAHPPASVCLAASSFHLLRCTVTSRPSHTWLRNQVP